MLHLKRGFNHLERIATRSLSGVPQGAGIGPLLYLLAALGDSVFLFADGAKIQITFSPTFLPSGIGEWSETYQ